MAQRGRCDLRGEGEAEGWRVVDEALAKLFAPALVGLVLMLALGIAPIFKFKGDKR